MGFERLRFRLRLDVFSRRKVDLLRGVALGLGPKGGDP